MADRTVVVGIAGSGKTNFAMRLIEKKLSEGMPWWQIGFCSFSRAACTEAAQRASVITGIPEQKLQTDGYFRTIHSAALRCLGVDPKVIVDQETAAGKKFYEEVFGVPRGGDAGTLAAKIDSALGEWDKARARLSGFSKVFRQSRQGPSGEPGVTFDGNANEFSNLSEDRHAYFSPDVEVLPIKTQGESEKSELIPYEDLKNKILCKQTLQKLRRSETDSFCDDLMDSNIQIPYVGKEKSENQFHPKVVTETWRSGIEMQEGEGKGTKVLSGVLTVPGGNKFSPETDAIIRKYEDQKRIWGKLDFTDILMKFAGIQADADLNLVQAYPEGAVPHEIRLWILDEYQDCSALLDAAAARLTETAEEVVMLGDTYQAVYGFSGSDWRVMRSHEVQAKADGKRVLLNRSWRNPESVLSWGEEVLRQDRNYEERRPTTERGAGTVGMIDSSVMMEGLEELAKTDTMILGRTWFALDRVKGKLDQLGIPWKSCQEKQKSRWEAPVKIAFVITMRLLRDGMKISEQDWRRICDELPQKWEGKELFERGIKAKWKKMECRHAETHGLGEVKEWGATEYFLEFVRDEIWRRDSALLIDMAIEKYGVELVREPKIRIGSVHSVKGAEARNVFCLASSSERASGVDTDFWEDLFLKYVAITRASWNYRVVVDLVEHARGKPLFLACPRGYWKFDKEMPSELVGVENTGGLPEVGADPAGSLGGEVFGRDLRNDGDTGCDSFREGTVRGDRDEEVGRKASRDARVSEGPDSQEWWNL
jgi:superfamily I DNA/RNA helicase